MKLARMFFMSSMIVASQAAIAMGPGPSSCKNLYSAQVVKATLVQDGREFKVTAKPGNTIVLRRGVDAQFRVTLAVAGESESGNKDEGQIWIGHKNATYVMGDCKNVDAGAKELVIDGPFTEDGGANPGSILTQGLSVYSRTGANKASSAMFQVRWVDNDKSGNTKQAPTGRAPRAAKG